jgi:5'-phosphate synthase pdxT subunit
MPAEEGIFEREPTSSGMLIGVLALQGAFKEHVECLNMVNVDGREVRTREDLRGLDGLIIPGGESTTMAKVAERSNMLEPLKEYVKAGKPVWGTCAGLILLADRLAEEGQKDTNVIGGLDITASRNYFGSGINSFEMGLEMPPLVASDIGSTEGVYNGVFIRGPAIMEVGANATPLCTVGQEDCARIKSAGKSTGAAQDVVVAVRQGNILATAFHPELTKDLRWHRMFATICTAALPAEGFQ